MIAKLTAALSCPAGWLVAILSLLIDNILGHGASIIMVLMVVIIDMYLGIRVSHKRGRFTLSYLARETVSKIEVYGIALLTFIAIDTILPEKISLTTEIISTVIILVEFWSTSAALLILYPGAPLLRLLQKALTGEIASKLDISTDEVDAILNNKKNNEQETTEADH